MMFHRAYWLPAALLFSTFVCAPPAGAQEIRAFWVDAFSDGFKSPEQVDTLIRRLQTAHCNAVFAQVRKSGDAYYLSRYEPWAADNHQHFDALADLIQKAHACKPRIQVHAWINTCAVGKTHGNPHHIVMAHPEWKSLSDKGEDYDNEATKIDPGNPDAADWTFRVYLDVVRHYDVDGIHFDFVRYGSTDGKGRWGYNPVSVARFNARYGRTGQPEWTDPLWKLWRRDQVTALVRKIYAMTMGVRPNVTVSAATITWLDGPHDEKGMNARKFWNEKSPGMNRVFQDWRSWMEEGILDLNCQMSYYQEKNHPDWYRHWIEWGKQNQYKRWVVPSSGIWLNPISDSMKQIEAIQAPGKKGKKAAGVLLYSYNGTDMGDGGKEQQSEEFFAALSQPSSYVSKPPFEKPAEFPEMPWKTKPKTGILKGFVLDYDLIPIDGVAVTLTGKVRRSQRTDGTGFYAFVDLPPGKYTILVDDPKHGRDTERDIAVSAGAATTETTLVGGPTFVYTYDVPTSDEPAMENAPVWLAAAEVVIGTDTFPGNLIVKRAYGPAKGVCRVSLPQEPLSPLQPGDVVALRGEIHKRDGENVIDADAVRLVDVKLSNEVSAVSANNSTAGGPHYRPDVADTIPSTFESQVERVQEDRVEMTAGGKRLQVMLAGRKLPGVEAAVSSISGLEVGNRLAVVGIAVPFHDKEGVGLRVYPLYTGAVQMAPQTFADRVAAVFRWSWLLLCAVVVPIWRRRLGRRRMAASP